MPPAAGSSQASASPEPERWGTPSSDLGASPAGGERHAPSAQAGQAAVRSLESSLGNAARGASSHAAAAVAAAGSEPVAGGDGTAHFNDVAKVIAVDRNAANAAVAAPEQASEAAASSALLGRDALRVPETVALQPEASDGVAAAVQHIATAAHAADGPPPDEVPCRTAASALGLCPPATLISCMRRARLALDDPRTKIC